MHRAVPEVLLGLTAAMLAPTSTCAYATADAGGSFNVVFGVPPTVQTTPLVRSARVRASRSPSIGVPPRLAATPLTVDRGLSVCPGRGCEGRAERDLAADRAPRGRADVGARPARGSRCREHASWARRRRRSCARAPGRLLRAHRRSPEAPRIEPDGGGRDHHLQGRHDVELRSPPAAFVATVTGAGRLVGVPGRTSPHELVRAPLQAQRSVSVAPGGEARVPRPGLSPAPSPSPSSLPCDGVRLLAGAAVRRSAPRRRLSRRRRRVIASAKPRLPGRRARREGDAAQRRPSGFGISASYDDWAQLATAQVSRLRPSATVISIGFAEGARTPAVAESSGRADGASSPTPSTRRCCAGVRLPAGSVLRMDLFFTPDGSSDSIRYRGVRVRVRVHVRVRVVDGIHSTPRPPRRRLSSSRRRCCWCVSAHLSAMRRERCEPTAVG
jgi:hypothetical protein